MFSAKRENMDQALCIMNALKMIGITTLKDKRKDASVSLPIGYGN